MNAPYSFRSEPGLRWLWLVALLAGMSGTGLLTGAESNEALYRRACQCLDDGRFEEAAEAAGALVAASEKENGKDAPGTMMARSLLAEAHLQGGRYEQAEPLFVEVLAFFEKTEGAEHPYTAIALNYLGILYRGMGRYEEAEPLLRRAVAIEEKRGNLTQGDAASSLGNLANLYVSMGRYAEAEPLLKRALEIKEKALPAEHPERVKPLGNLATCYKSMGRHADAEPLYKRALVLSERINGPEHTLTASALSQLGGLYQTMNRLEEAEPILTRALAIDAKISGPEHPFTAVSLYQLALLKQSQGKTTEAIPLAERQLRVVKAMWERVLGYFSERESLAFQSTQVPMDLPGMLGNARLAAEAQLLFKGAVLEAMNQRRADEGRLRQDAEGRKLMEQRERLRPLYTRKLLSLGPGAKEVLALQGQLETLDKQAAQLIGQGGAVMSGLDAVKAGLKPGETLIECFRYRDWQRARPEQRYAAVAIPQEGEPVYVPLGEAQAIEKAVADYRHLIAGEDGKLLELSREARDQRLAGIEARLSALLLAPLEKELKPEQAVILSLDAQLHFLPVGMLRDAEGRAFAEKYEVRYVSSGRDLIKPLSPRRMPGDRSALILGNPAYDDGAPAKALAQAESEAPEVALTLTLALRSGLGRESGLQFSPLPGTAQEMTALSGQLESAGYRVVELTEREATEAAVMKQVAGQDVVHLATHGFFLPELRIGNAAENGPQRGGGEASPILVQNPMFRSGLALTGAQSTFELWARSQVPPPARDGVLLAAEVAGIDLRGTDLVVLSACETAVGESLNGEGVIGLRRALNAAGATHVIMTLWPVNDEATVAVMEAFYRKYLGGTPAPRALAEVQRELLPVWSREHGPAEALTRLAPFICTSLGPVP